MNETINTDNHEMRLNLKNINHEELVTSEDLETKPDERNTTIYFDSIEGEFPLARTPSCKHLPFNITPDANMNQQKKIEVQDTVDLALLSGNVSQLIYILWTNGKYPFFYATLGMIVTSLLLQIAIGIGIIWISNYVKQQHEIPRLLNTCVMVGIFLMIVLNVFITCFSAVDEFSAAINLIFFFFFLIT